MASSQSWTASWGSWRRREGLPRAARPTPAHIVVARPMNSILTDFLRKKVKNQCTWFRIKLTSLCGQWVWGELYQRQTWFEPRWQKSRPAHRRTLQGYQRGKGAWQRGQHLGNNETVLHKTFTIFCSDNLIYMIPDINVAAANTLKIPQRSCHQIFQLLG